MTKLILIFRILFLLLSGLFLPSLLFAQTDYPAEKIDLISDRNIYISGENISFSAIVSSTSENDLFSKSAYIELITAEGRKISKEKISITNGKFHGQLSIPQDALSGYYFLRAYTKWMRNGDVYDYDYLRIKLINPFNVDLVEVSDSLIDNSILDSIEIKSTFHLDKTTYKIGEKLILSPNESTSLSFSKATLSIVTEGSEELLPLPLKTEASSYDSIIFYPETRGLSISGKVIDKKSGEPIPYHRVNVHLKDEKNFIAVLCDSSGQFYIALPKRYGTIELFVISATKEDVEIEVLIDQDFCTKKVALKVPSFILTKEDKEKLLFMAQRFQLQTIFYSQGSLEIKPISENAFFGHPHKTIDFDSFVELDSLSQYFTDLPSWVKVRKHNGKRKLSIGGSETELYINDPLILLDWIPVDDDEAVLAINPLRIKKFDVVINPYIHGQINYGGIINISSRNLDFAGFNFPESAMYINFDFYSEPKSSSNQSQKSLNNTYLWIPDLPIEEISTTLELNIPSIKGSYFLLLQAINEKGEKTISKERFTVE